MGRVTVVYFCQPSGRCEFLEYLDSSMVVIRAGAFRLIERLESDGPMLKRPQSAPLGNGIFELRAPYRGHQLRILYFFHEGRAVVTNVFEKKTRTVPDDEIKKAIARKRTYLEDPQRHTWKDET
jgi:phage-related protein